MDQFDWTCPFCDRDVTLTEQGTREATAYLDIENIHGKRGFRTLFVVCPNPKCKQFTLTGELVEAYEYGDEMLTSSVLKRWDLIPASKAKALPNYIPQSIVDDYSEACMILSLSPKASATLARRCLQGMIRDFWHVKPGRLKDEVDALQGRIDPLTWDSIEAVRKVGNIGAHMESDINVIVDVEPKEAQLLVGLIEFLIKDWYIANENKKQHLAALVGVAAQKNVQKKQSVAVVK